MSSWQPSTSDPFRRSDAFRIAARSCRVTDDDGNYELTGSVTGSDGTGNVLKPLISNSGQMGVPPKLRRHGAGCVPFLSPWDGKLLNRTGDTYSFNVYRACKSMVDFRGELEP